MSEPAPKEEPAIELRADKKGPTHIVATRAQRQRVWATRIRRLVGLLFAGAVIAAAVLAWLPEPVRVEVVPVKRGQLQVTVDETGRTRVKDRYMISAPQLGSLARITLRAGDVVEPGAVLARLVPLDPPLLDAQSRSQLQARVAAASAARMQTRSAVERVRSTLDIAEREAKRLASLRDTGAASASVAERAELEARTMREELTSATFGASVADHDLQMAQAALGRLGKSARSDQLELTSPVKGRILRVIQESEGVVQPGTPLIEIGDPAALEIVVEVFTNDAVNIKPGARALIDRWGGPAALDAHVRVVEPSAFRRISPLGVEEQRVNVVLDLDAPQQQWSSLGDGFAVEARIITWESDDVLLVPASAVFRRGEQWAAFMVRGDKVHERMLKLGHRTPDKLELVSGLSAGDLVVEHPSERLVDGVQVQAR